MRGDDRYEGFLFKESGTSSINITNTIRASSKLLADIDLPSMSLSYPGGKVVIKISDVKIQERPEESQS